MVNLSARRQNCPSVSRIRKARRWMRAHGFLTVARIQNGETREPMMTQSLFENQSFQEGILSVQLEGPVDMMTVPTIRQTLLGFARRKKIKELHVDFSRVTLLDTSGVAMLVEVWKGLAREGGVLRLTGLSEQARRLMQLARLDHVFEIGNDPKGRM
jgi:anti-sigma B factor antagonist